MDVKRLLKFYFGADRLNGALDNIIVSNALKSGSCEREGEYYADKIIAIICAKSELNNLWLYIDGVVSSFEEREKKILKLYGGMRGGLANLPAEQRKEIKRVTIKFSRRARSVARFEKGVNLVKKYYCLTGGI